jgi:hypothetical protein
MSFAPSPDLTKPNHGASCGPPGHRAPRHGESFREKSWAPDGVPDAAPRAPKRLGGHARLVVVVAKWRAPRTAQPVRAWRGRPPPFTSLGGRSDLALPFGSPCPRARASRERASERERATATGKSWSRNRAAVCGVCAARRGFRLVLQY